MPNLRQIISLKEQFGHLTEEEARLKDFIEKSETKDFIEKGFRNEILDDRRFSFLLEHLQVNQRRPNLIQYFESSPEEDVVLLFIDITSFSKIVTDMNSLELKNYLDSYYAEAIDIIYSHDGEIEKLMGDGIICVFGKPFINVAWPEEFNKAEMCAYELIQHFMGTEKEVKVALHSGAITYYKTPGTQYEEYTMIGRPITELYRLESVSRPNAINFYRGSIYDAINPIETQLGLSVIDPDDVINLYGFNVNLQGVDAYDRVRYLKF